MAKNYFGAQLWRVIYFWKFYFGENLCRKFEMSHHVANFTNAKFRKIKTQKWQIFKKWSFCQNRQIRYKFPKRFSN